MKFYINVEGTINNKNIELDFYVNAVSFSHAIKKSEFILHHTKSDIAINTLPLIVKTISANTDKPKHVDTYCVSVSKNKIDGTIVPTNHYYLIEYKTTQININRLLP